MTMKTVRIIFFAIIILLTTVSITANDWKNFGVKGQCSRVSSDNEKLSFDEDGNLTEFWFNTSYGSVESQSIIALPNGFEGECTIRESYSSYSGQYTITLGSDGITQLEVTYDDNDDNQVTIISSFGYSNGNLSDRTDNKQWYEMEENHSSDYEREQLYNRAQGILKRAMKECAKHPRDTNRNNRIMNEARKEASEVLQQIDEIPSQLLSENHSSTTVFFTDYSFDKFNNWIKRSYISEGNYSKENENREISYTRDFTDNAEWEKVKNKNDLKAIEQFAKNSSISQQYRTIAAEYWNNNIIDKIQRIDNNNIDSLLYVINNSISTQETIEKAMSILRQEVYQNQVLNCNDFSQVMEMKSMTINGITIFDEKYQSLIESQSNQLRQDSINNMVYKAETELYYNKNKEAIKTAKKVLSIDNDNQRAKEIMAEANFKIIEEKEKNGTIGKNDYFGFFKTNRGSQYDLQVGNKLAQYAISQEENYNKNKSDYYSFLSSILNNNYPMNNELKNQLRSWVDKYESKERTKRRFNNFFGFNREGEGHLVSVGPEFNLGLNIKSVEFKVGAGLAARIGYVNHRFNLQVGAIYEYTTKIYMNRYKEVVNNDNSSTQKFINNESRPTFPNHHLTTGRLVIPLMLRWNLVNVDDYDNTLNFYLGGGVQFSLPLHGKAKINDDVENLSYDNLRGFMISPRLALGLGSQDFECELFSTFINNSLFNRDKLIDAGIDQFIGEKYFDKQTIKGTQVHIGLSMRYLF